MSATLSDVATEAIVVDEVFPHAPATIWRALTDGALMAKWLMPAQGFSPEVGCTFSFSTTAAGAWDGTIRCEVLEVVPETRLSYAWRGGDDGNAGYGSRLDTIVTFLLSAVEGGTRVRLVHSGFELPRNKTAFENMGSGWPKVLQRLAATSDEEA